MRRLWALATRLGYAEADPTADIQGLDAGRKMAILASIAFNSRVTFEDVITEGITHISAKDIRYARELGCVIKLMVWQEIQTPALRCGSSLCWFLRIILWLR